MSLAGDSVSEGVASGRLVGVGNKRRQQTYSTRSSYWKNDQIKWVFLALRYYLAIVHRKTRDD